MGWAEDVILAALSRILSVDVEPAEDGDGIETFAKAKQEWFARYLDLTDGPYPVPSDDTFRRTISRLDPEAFETAFRQWIAAVAAQVDSEVNVVDGKTLRGSYDRDAKTLQAERAPQAPLLVSWGFLEGRAVRLPIVLIVAEALTLPVRLGNFSPQLRGRLGAAVANRKRHDLARAAENRSGCGRF